MSRGRKTTLRAEAESVDLDDVEPRLGDLIHRVAVEVAAPSQPRPQRTRNVLGETNHPALGTNVLVEAKLTPWTQDAADLSQGSS